MSIFEKQLPQYDKFMYLQGYTPEQILAAARKDIYDRAAAPDSDNSAGSDEVVIITEVRKE